MDWVADRYDNFQKAYQLKNGLALIDKLEAFTRLRDKSILDLGCGNGELTLLLHQKSDQTGKITAIDRDHGMLAQLRQKAGSQTIELHEADLLTWLRSTHQQYDLIFSNAVLHWLQSDAEFSLFLQEAQRCLYRQGYLALRFSLIDNAAALKDFLQTHLRRYLNDAELHLSRSIFEFETCLEQLIGTGFQSLYATEQRFTPFAQKTLSFRWMIESQPLLTHLPRSQLNDFETYLWQQWQQHPVQVKSHHGLFIAQK